MAKKYEAEQRIEEIRHRINNITELISSEKSIVKIIKENPACSIITLFIMGILAAIISRKILRLVLGLVSYGLKATTFLFFIKQGIPYLSKLKRINML